MLETPRPGIASRYRVRIENPGTQYASRHRVPVHPPIRNPFRDFYGWIGTARVAKCVPPKIALRFRRLVNRRALSNPTKALSSHYVKGLTP